MQRFVIVRRSASLGPMARNPALRFLSALALLCLPSGTSQAADDACGASQIVIIDRVTERGELTLSDGRTLRLAGLDLGVPPAEGGSWQSFLSDLTRDATLRISSPTEADRWGRIAAQLYVTPRESSEEAWLQAFLLEIGAARLLPEPDARACWTALKAEEDKARLGKAGLWAATGAVLDPAAPEAILKKRGQLAMVEGKIAGIGESRAVFYLNFGRSWRNDFTVIILKRQAKLFDSAGLKPATLANKRVRVRGIVDGQSGPRIELAMPEQIEVLD